MAIILEQATRYGVSVTYHRIIGWTVAHVDDSALTVIIASYQDRDARLAGMTPPAQAAHRVTWDALGTRDPARTDMYRALKDLPSFAGAVDDE